MALPFGRYQLLRKIASGGMGQVFLARADGERGFEKLLVIKRILPHLVEDEEFFTMFFDEARIAARLNHPNVVQIFDLGEVEGSHFLAMEYVPGDDVRRVDKVARSKGVELPLGVICRVIADAAAGLDYAHKARDAQGQPLGLVHRDVSPQNVLVGFDGGVKLIDFGVAKAAGRMQRTATGILKGKYAYMSPEQAEGEEIDHRSDVFALGIVFWELLTGKRLFKGDTEVMTMRLVKDCQVPPPSRLTGIAAELDAIVLRALAKDRHERFPDAMALRLAIEDFVVAQHIPASSAHLVSFMRELYADRIEQEADPAWLDQLSPTCDLDLAATPSRPKSQNRSAVEPRGLAITSVAPEDAPSKQGLTATAERPARGGLRPVVVLLSAGIILGVGFGAMKLWPSKPTPRPEPVSVEVPVEPEKPSTPPDVQVKLLSEPLGATVEIDGKAVGVTPLSYPLAASSGPKVALFTKEGFEPQQASLSPESPEIAVQLKRKARKNGAGRPLGIKTGR